MAVPPGFLHCDHPEVVPVPQAQAQEALPEAAAWVTP